MSEKGNGLELPRGWVWVNLGEITESIRPGFPSGKHNKENRGVPHLRPMNISAKGEITFSDVKYVETTLYEQLLQGDVLFNNTNSPELVGKTSYIRQDTNWAYSNHMTRVRVYKEYVEPAWVAQFLHNLFLAGFFRLHCTNHVNQASINSTFLAERVSIPLPPLSEQRRIVAKLEELFSDLDAGVEALKKAKAQLKRYRQAVLKAAVEGRLVPQDPTDEPASRLLERILAESKVQRHANSEMLLPTDHRSATYSLPDGWSWTNVGQLAEVGTGASPLRSKQAYYTEGTIPWVTSSALNNLFVDHADQFITDLALKETRTKIFPAGSLLVALYGEGKTRGKVSELLIDAATNQACATLLFSGQSSECKGYVKLFFQRNYEDIRRSSSGGVQPNLNLALIKQTRIPLPPLAEQQRIIAEVDHLCSDADGIEQAIILSLNNGSRLRQTLLKRAFSGKLVPQDPSDEPAEKLLERIKAERAAREANGKERKGRAKKTSRQLELL